MAGRKSVRERPAIDRILITTTAWQMIDEIGVDGLTMRALAARLGVSAMALYHHVDNKDELLRMVGDDLLGRIELPDPDTGDWRAIFTSVVTASVDSLLGVPGLSSVLLSSKMLPNARRLVVFGIHQFERAGLDRSGAQEAYAAVQQLVLGRLFLEENANFGLNPTPKPDDEIRDYMVKLRSRSSFYSALSVLLDHYLAAQALNR